MKKIALLTGACLLLTPPLFAQLGALGGIVGLPGVGQGLGPYFTLGGDLLAQGQGAAGYNYSYLPIATFYGDRLDRVFANQRGVFMRQAFEVQYAPSSSVLTGLFVPISSWEVRTVDPTTDQITKQHDAGLDNPRVLAKFLVYQTGVFSSALRAHLVLPSGYAVGTDTLGGVVEAGTTVALPQVDLRFNPGYIYSGSVKGKRLTDLAFANLAISTNASSNFDLFAEINYYSDLTSTTDQYRRQALDAQGNLAVDPITGNPIYQTVRVNLYQSRLDFTPGVKMMFLNHVIVTAAMLISIYNVYKLGYRYEYVGAIDYVF